MIQTFNEVTAGLTQFMLKEGLNSTTVHSYQKRFYNPLQNYLEANNCKNYSKDLLNDYLNERTAQFTDGKICKGYFLQWKRIIRFIIEYAEHSSCDFSYQYKITTFSSSAYDAVFSSICSREKNTNMISYLRSLLRANAL